MRMEKFQASGQIIDEYRAWAIGHSAVIGGEIDVHDPINLLGFLKDVGYLKERQNEPQEEKRRESEFVVFNSRSGRRALIKRANIIRVEEDISEQTDKYDVLITHIEQDSIFRLTVSDSFDEVMAKLGLLKKGEA